MKILGYKVVIIFLLNRYKRIFKVYNIVKCILKELYVYFLVGEEKENFLVLR